jgi:hypothetical protein
MAVPVVAVLTLPPLAASAALSVAQTITPAAHTAAMTALTAALLSLSLVRTNACIENLLVALLRFSAPIVRPWRGNGSAATIDRAMQGASPRGGNAMRHLRYSLS